MHLSIAAATLLACTATTVQAFADSSPFMLVSTVALPKTLNNAQLQTSSQVLDSAKEILKSCPTDRYIFVSQPNLHAADIRREANNPQCMTSTLCGMGMDQRWAPNLYSVAEVIGQVSGEPLKEFIKDACTVKGREGALQIETVELKHLPAAVDAESLRDRLEVLRDNDHELNKLISVLPEHYTLILFSDPSEFKLYEPGFSSEPAAAVHMDLKRWSEADGLLERRRPSNSTGERLPLFQKYQFFTPAVFTALVVLIVILSILTVGIRALASLEVSYGAFDKEMGPAAQKKQM